MENSTNIQSFVLAAYGDIGYIRYFYFCVILVMHFSIIISNLFIILAICTQKNLQEPMYWFLCNLCVNELYGSLALYPSLLVYMLSNMKYEISKVNCLLQVWCINNYASVEFISLAAMAYDRYLSICYPLNYNKIMTPTKVTMFIFFIWIFCSLKVSITIILTTKMPLCGNRINKIYCDNYSLVKLSCTDITFNNIYGLVNLFISVVVPALLIVYSYAIILKICLRASKESQIKAFKTCSPHLASLINFAIGCLFEVIQSRFDMSHVTTAVQIFVSVYFLMITPIFNPIIYGVRYTKIRMLFKRFQTKKVTQQ